MYGWWGAQAGHLVRMADDSLWFVDDTGRNASVDPALNYYRFNAGSWTKVASLTLLPTIQQNTASIANGSYIYTYGVNIAQQVIEECYLSTKNPAVRACNNLSFPAAASNYIGATIGPDGTRVVWWTTTSTTVGGRWNYIYTTKSGWVGPITSTAGGYQDFSYALGRLDTGGRFELVGSAAKGLGGAAVGYASLYGSTTLGKPVTNWQVVAATGLGSDIVFDQAGGTHALVWDATSKTTKYFYKPKGGKIAAQPYTWNTSNKMRFALTKNTLYLLVPDLSATSTTMLVKSVPFASVTGPIDWNAAEAASVPIQKGIGTVAIYPESPSYSITSPSTLGFVINGFNAQGSLYYVQPH